MSASSLLADEGDSLPRTPPADAGGQTSGGTSPAGEGASHSLVSETQRLGILRRYHVLDTAPEAMLDDLASLAATICGTPIALISLVDERRQWFKSRIGFDATETARETSFCAHTLHQPSVLIVPDAARDSRFAHNPMVTGELGIRFYAGAPLVTPEGATLGALCVKDRVPRTLTAEQVQALGVLARQVMTHLELKRHARELAASEQRLRIATDNARIGLAIVNREHRYVYANETYAIIRGLPSTEVLNRRIADLIPEIYETQIRARLDRAFAGERVAFEIAAPTAAGTRHFSVRYELTEINGAVEYVIFVITDITEQREAEEALRHHEAILEETGRIAKVGGWEFDPATGHGTWTDEVARIHDLEAGTPISMQAGLEYYTGPSRKLIEAAVREAIRSGTPFDLELEIHSAKGTRKWVRSIGRPVVQEGRVMTIRGSFQDITERRTHEAAVRASEGRYRTLFECAPDGILIADGQSNYLDANPSALRMFGYSEEEFVGLHANDIVVPAETMHVSPALGAIKSDGNYHREWEFRRKDGSTFQADVIATPMPDGNLLGMIRDVTERKRAETRFRRLVDSNAQGVFFWNSRGEVTGANDAFLRLLGYATADLETGALQWTDLTPPEYAEADRRNLEEIKARGVCAPVEKEFLRKDGARVPVLCGAAAFEDNPSEGVCFVVDLSERKKLEQQFLRSQRMESIGTLAGGIAHDLNNALAPILMSLDLLKMQVTDPTGRQLIGVLETSAQRGADMVRQVLSFARGVEGQRMAVQVSHLLRDVEKISGDTFLKNISVRADYPPDLWAVVGDPTQLHQVLVNLCVNARDAMPRGGRLAITAGNAMLDAPYAALNLEATPGPYVFIKVEDSGVGMSPDVLEKIFDPFFTTKAVGKGTGLGLSTSEAIVKSHGGFIRAYSEVGKGSKFEVYLPAQTTPMASGAATAAAEMPRGQGELILVVDDEAAVRQVTEQTLEAFGYRVLLAADGAEAVAVYANRGVEIDAVLTDMMMPVMDGPATIIVLRKLNPHLPIIAASGLTANGHDHHAPIPGVRHFLPKPYTAEALLQALRKVLRPAG